MEAIALTDPRVTALQARLSNLVSRRVNVAAARKFHAAELTADVGLALLRQRPDQAIPLGRFIRKGDWFPALLAAHDQGVPVAELQSALHALRWTDTDALDALHPIAAQRRPDMEALGAVLRLAVNVKQPLWDKMAQITTEEQRTAWALGALTRASHRELVVPLLASLTQWVGSYEKGTRAVSYAVGAYGEASAWQVWAQRPWTPTAEDRLNLWKGALRHQLVREPEAWSAWVVHGQGLTPEERRQWGWQTMRQMVDVVKDPWRSFAPVERLDQRLREGAWPGMGPVVLLEQLAQTYPGSPNPRYQERLDAYAAWLQTRTPDAEEQAQLHRLIEAMGGAAAAPHWQASHRQQQLDQRSAPASRSRPRA